MAVFTVCRALKALAGAGVILAQICMKANRAHASNSYFFLCQPCDRTGGPGRAFRRMSGILYSPFFPVFV